MAVGYVVERVAYRPLRNAPRLAPLITAIGVSIVLQHLALLVWTRNIIAFPQIIELKLYHLGNSDTSAAISNVQIAIIIASVVMMAGLLALVTSHQDRHRDARHLAEPAGRGPHGRGHQRGDLHHLRDRRGAGRGGGRDGRDLLRHRALPDGIPARA